MIQKIINWVSIILVLVFAFYFTLYSFIDGKSNLTFDSAISDTDYSKGYSDLAFLSVKEGQSKEQVIKKIGEGFECIDREKRDENIFPSNYILFCKYSKSDRYAYRTRMIVYDKDNKVIAKLTGVIPD
ncbi:MAG TPA: hypothetical protein PK079_26355 [Leptospiraceae bacterium]|nr:hypothetical protein [Leptospiraceae bacterium]HMY34454.1 hypothetical protein [Leptospiraceae bacterium]HMZ67554.1 hypothetical protein [Leptospiraceae bacterium]HNB99518.1 hypothetical protein [Leptospiraceae bacterium]HNC59880.1 hypothetical protein [Leptospiraceae bacterium]